MIIKIHGVKGISCVKLKFHKRRCSSAIIFMFRSDFESNCGGINNFIYAC